MDSDQLANYRPKSVHAERQERPEPNMYKHEDTVDLMKECKQAKEIEVEETQINSCTRPARDLK